MNMKYLNRNKTQRLAYVHLPAKPENTNMPAVMFLGGFKSDMEGTKALYLQKQCEASGQEFVRFDYSGHGVSDGAFEDGTIGTWKNDARAILDQIVKSKNVILVGSSMGGWIALLLLLERAERIKGMIGIAAAPDFTQEILARLSAEQREIMMHEGRIEIPNDYSDEPYIFTRALIEDGEENNLLDEKRETGASMILIQGKQDADVPWEKALHIQECFDAHSCEVIFVEDGDHRLSRAQDLALIWAQIRKLS